MVAKARVTTYKRSGKYYTQHEVELKPEHIDMYGFDLERLISLNDPQVSYLSPVSSAFGSLEFYHSIDVDYGEGRNFCTFLLKPFDQRRGIIYDKIS